jgi:hypothetical protein
VVKRIIALLIVAVSLLPAPGRAQTGPALSILEVDLWPEYDRPSMLVLYKATLPAGVALPVELTFRIPEAAGEPHAVAVQQGTALFSVAYDRQVSGEWALITFTATSPQVRLEYYDPALSIEGRPRHFEYQWPGDYGVSSFLVQVQQPTGAEDMRISPSLGNGSQGEDGLIYYHADLGSLEAGETFTITVDYQKDTDTLSADDLEIQPSAPITAETPGRVNTRALLPWILGLAGLLLIAGGGWWYWRSSREAAPSKGRRRRISGTAGVDVRPEKGPQGEVYCHQCGKRASPGDRFCRSCGARLRIE